jgi:hypothetical protein
MGGQQTIDYQSLGHVALATHIVRSCPPTPDAVRAHSAPEMLRLFIPQMALVLVVTSNVQEHGIYSIVCARDGHRPPVIVGGSAQAA